MWRTSFVAESIPEDEARIVSLRYIYELDNSLGLLKDLPCGYCAERESLKVSGKYISNSFFNNEKSLPETSRLKDGIWCLS